MLSSPRGAAGSVSDGRALALLGADHTLMRWFVFHRTANEGEETYGKST